MPGERLPLTAEVAVPGISTTINIIGWLAIVGAVFAVIASTFDGGSGSAIATALELLIPGICFLAFAAIITKLYEIEHHQRRMVEAVYRTSQLRG